MVKKVILKRKKTKHKHTKNAKHTKNKHIKHTKHIKRTKQGKKKIKENKGQKGIELSDKYGTPKPMPFRSWAKPFFLLQNCPPLYAFNPELKKILTEIGKQNKYFFKVCVGKKSVLPGFRDLIPVEGNILDINFKNVSKKHVVISLDNISKKKYNYVLYEDTYRGNDDDEGNEIQINQEPVDVSDDGINGIYFSIEVININTLMSISPSINTKFKVYDKIATGSDEYDWDDNKDILTSETINEIKRKVSGEDEEVVEQSIETWKKIQPYKGNIFVFNFILIENGKVNYDKLFISSSIIFYDQFITEGWRGDNRKYCIWKNSDKNQLLELNSFSNLPLIIPHYDMSKLVKSTKKKQQMKQRKINPLTGSFGSFSSTTSSSTHAVDV